MKILFHPTTGKIWGAQAIGYEGVDKRIDVISSFIGMDGTVYDLAEFEHAYAPPFSSAKDPINMVGFIGMNALEGISNPISWREVDDLIEQGGNPRRSKRNGNDDGRNAARLDQHSTHRFKETNRRSSEGQADHHHVRDGGAGISGRTDSTGNGFTKVYNLTGGLHSYTTVMSERARLN